MLEDGLLDLAISLSTVGVFFMVLKGQIERPYFFGTIELVSGAATMVS